MATRRLWSTRSLTYSLGIRLSLLIARHPGVGIGYTNTVILLSTLIFHPIRSHHLTYADGDRWLGVHERSPLELLIPFNNECIGLTAKKVAHRCRKPLNEVMERRVRLRDLCYLLLCEFHTTIFVFLHSYSPSSRFRASLSAIIRVSP